MKTLIFDFDGTLVDSMSLYISGFNRVAKEFDLPEIKKKDIKAIKQLSAKELMSRYEISSFKLAKIIYKVNKNLNQDIPNIEFFKGVRSLLLSLSSKYQLGILSSNHLENIKDFLKNQNFLDIFDFVYVSKNLFGKDKTLSTLIKKFHLDKEDILYFGDELRDIEACQKLGVKVAAVTWGVNEKDILVAKNPDFIFSSPEEISHLLL